VFIPHSSTLKLSHHPKIPDAKEGGLVEIECKFTRTQRFCHAPNFTLSTSSPKAPLSCFSAINLGDD
jgi:hypothetical protein